VDGRRHRLAVAGPQWIRRSGRDAAAADPAFLQPFLARSRRLARRLCCCIATRITGRPPIWRTVYPHVYFDVGLALNFVGPAATSVLAEAMELAPFGKLLHSSDAFGLPELYYLGALRFRRALSGVLDSWLDRDEVSIDDARRIAE